MDLPWRRVTAIAHPPGVSLSFIDGLYASKASLVAVQNGPMLPRITQFTLDSTGRRITGIRILERRNALFDGLTTGCLTGATFYYIPNTPWTKRESTLTMRFRFCRF